MSDTNDDLKRELIATLDRFGAYADHQEDCLARADDAAECDCGYVAKMEAAEKRRNELASEVG